VTNWLGLVSEEATSSVQSDGRLVNDYTRTYLFRTDSYVRPTASEIASAIGILIGSPIDGDTKAICHRAKIGPGPTMTKPPHLAYLVTYDWSTAAPKPETVDTDPTTRRTIWSITPNIQSRYVIKDKNGKLIVNKAGDPYDGGIPADVRLGTLTANRIKDATGYDKAAVLANSGKLNSTTYLGGEPGTVQVDIAAVEKYEGAYHFWEETYTFSYDPQGWQPKPLNAGFYHLGTGKKRRITNADEDPTTDVEPTGLTQEPSPLDDDGEVVPRASRPDSCTFVEVEYYEEMDFDSFGLS